MNRDKEGKRWFGFAVAISLLMACSVRAAPVQWSVNGHWYEAVTAPLTWDAANSAASASTFMGMSGHLATITSAAESLFISALRSELTLYAIGGSQDPFATAPGAGWRWVTGEAFAFTNWHAGEPNDFPFGSNGLPVERIGSGSEDFLSLWSGRDAEGATWNDVNNVSAMTGYIVEYERAPVTEPTTLALFAVGLAGLGLSRRWALARVSKRIAPGVS